MRVALVDPASYTPPYDHSLAAALARRGHDVHLLTSGFAFDDPPAPQGYRRDELFLPLSTRLTRRAPRSPLRLPLKLFEYGPSALRLVRRVNSLAPDVVHLQWLALPRYDLLWVRRVARKSPLVLTAHDVVPRRRGQLDAWRQVLRIVDRVVVHSARAVEQLVELGVERERVTRIPHPVFAVPAERIPAPPHGRTLLFFGLVRDYKGLDVLVSALPAVLAQVPDARLVIAGDPLDPVEPVRTLAHNLGVDGRIDWRLRFIREHEIAGLMAEASVVVLPYRQIDSSGVLATAIGHRRPAIVTDVGQLGETVRDFQAGLVVPPGDVPALAAACAKLLRDEAALAAAARGAEAASKTLTWEAAAEAHERLYAELLADGVG
jgi:glycosyltransferase involved in cell wall biosynthesis